MHQRAPVCARGLHNLCKIQNRLHARGSLIICVHINGGRSITEHGAFYVALVAHRESCLSGLASTWCYCCTARANYLPTAALESTARGSISRLELDAVRSRNQPCAFEDTRSSPWSGPTKCSCLPVKRHDTVGPALPAVHVTCL